MDKVLKRVTNHKKQSTSSTAKSRDHSNQVSAPSINKRYSVDDNFYTYINREDLHDSCNGSNYYTISNRGDFKRSTNHRSRFQKQENGDKQIAREDASFKKFLRVFNSGENSRGAKDWIANSANNMMDFAPKLFTKRFHGKKGENELYRSNSFKFERFERVDSDTLSSAKKSPVLKQISLCDDYSLPVDFVNKRPLSLDSGSLWSAQSPNGDQVEVLNLYCDPKDSARNQLQSSAANNSIKPEEQSAEILEEKLKLYSVVNKEPKEYCRPHKESSEAGEHEDDEPELYENLKHRKLTALARTHQKGSTYTEVRRSPYYYGDLVKRCHSEDKADSGRYELNSYRKCQSLDVTYVNDSQLSKDQKYVDPSVNSFDIREEDEEDEEMANKQRHMYETAFDSKICQTNETLDMDVVTNHVMERYSPQLPYNPTFCGVSKDNKCSLKRLKNAKNKANSSSKYESSVDNISQHLTDLEINDQSTLLHGYSSASTSTIPLPQSVSSNIHDSCESFFNSSHQGSKTQSEKCSQEIQKRVKNGSSPIYANSIINNNNNNESRKKNINNINNFFNHNHHKHKPVFCYRNEECCVSDSTNESRPRNSQLKAKILEIKSRPKERNSRRFSSTESMVTSSSGGSLESIRSSTSEGNRSTTSTDSRHSSSLSSHSSDSTAGNGSYFSMNFQLGNRFLNQNKMHILSPISDKSFQEVGSEGSEMNRNNSSQKVSPEESRTASPDAQQSRVDVASYKAKRRVPQNKNISNLNSSFTSNGDAEAHQCSDSGISIESKSDTAKVNQTTDLSELPFDMPKLRRRRLQQMQLAQSTQDTSSSATSIDLKDLPFDMPKLRRKLKSSSAQESMELSFDSSNPCMSTATEEQTEETNKQLPILDAGKNRRSLGLSLNLSEIIPPGSNIDTDLPLERQGWYHGAITRMEAESELRNREEGSYLVRNSESAKNDYSLSLKSAKGFMHMRIQKSSDANKFILGQFSAPFDSIPEMIKHYSSNQLPIRGAEHMCLLQPVIAQLL